MSTLSIGLGQTLYALAMGEPLFPLIYNNIKSVSPPPPTLEGGRLERADPNYGREADIKGADPNFGRGADLNIVGGPTFRRKIGQRFTPYLMNNNIKRCVAPPRRRGGGGGGGGADSTNL